MSTEKVSAAEMEANEILLTDGDVDEDNAVSRKILSSKDILQPSQKNKCPGCSLKFSSLVKLLSHKTHCKKLSSHTTFCWSCKRKFKFRLHFLRHHCTKLYQRRQDNKKLLKENLTKAKGWVDEQKQKQTEEHADLDTIESDTSNDIITCRKCDETFSSIKSFQLHHIRDLCKTKESLCEICKKTFQDVDEFEFHKAHCEDRQKMIEKLKEKKLELKRLQQKLNKTNIFTCRSCKNKCYSPQQLKRHFEQHPYCTRIHNMKIKLRCMWERGNDMTKTARKSPHNYRKKSSESFPIVKKLKQLKKYDWDMESNTSVDSYEKKPICGAARKTFPRPSSKSKKGEFCDICYQHFSSLLELKLHKVRHYQAAAKMNKCPQCPESFLDTCKLLIHQNAMDHWGKATKSITTISVCPVCGKEFSHLPSRNEHIRTHMSECPEEVKEFLDETTCDICFQIFSSEMTKIQHIRLKHSKKLEQPRNSVEEIFQSHKYVGYSNKNVLLNVTPDISRLLKKNPNECPICHKKYSTSFIRNRHFRTHSLDQAFECKFCPTKFPRSDRLTQHMQVAHNDFLAYECMLCSLRFPTRIRALQHGSKAHSEAPANNLIRERNVVNSILRKSFQFTTGLKAVNNNDAVIPDEEFYCEVCELSFLKLCGLQRHKQSKLHKDIYEKSLLAVKYEGIEIAGSECPPLSITPPFIDYSQKFTCSACFMDFDGVNDFVPHRLSHFTFKSPAEDINELKMYTCEVCGRIMNNHQQIQLHLFWHLQDVQLQAGPKKNHNKTIQSTAFNFGKSAVAKKSFTKGDNKRKEELVIAGIKKPLFTCDFCKIGFTTLQHYQIHIRQYCKSRKAPVQSIVEIKETKPSFTAGFCKICGSIFSSTELYEEHKTLFCNNNNYTVLNENAEILYTEMVKSLVKLDSMVAGCVRCNIAFNSIIMLSQHSLTHVLQDGEPVQTNTVSPKQVDLISPDLFGNQVTNDDEITFINHDVLQNDKIDCAQFSDSLLDGKTKENHDKYDDQNIPVSDDNITDQIFLMDLDITASKLAESEIDTNGPNIATANENESIHDTSEKTDSLRDNFTRLLCVLVSDQDLMDQLGYGRKPIDDVLVNVLNQMGLAPVPAEEECNKLERLRRNIRILLDVCIKDQIMDFIANSDATTDSIVMSALKMFNADEALSALIEV